jgi:hypothetical protein
MVTTKDGAELTPCSGTEPEPDSHGPDRISILEGEPLAPPALRAELPMPRGDAIIG